MKLVKWGEYKVCTHVFHIHAYHERLKPDKSGSTFEPYVHASSNFVYGIYISKILCSTAARISSTMPKNECQAPNEGFVCGVFPHHTSLGYQPLDTADVIPHTITK